MSINWTTKEKLLLLSNILEYGDQAESWSTVSNNLSRILQKNLLLSPMKRDGRYSVKVGFLCNFFQF